MTDYAYNLYETIIGATDSEYNIFFIIVALLVPTIIGLLIKSAASARKHEREREQHERERERHVIEVVSKNSEVIAGLKATLEGSKEATVKAIDRIHVRIDGQADLLANAVAEVGRIKTLLVGAVENQRETASKINKVLLIVSGGKADVAGQAKDREKGEV